MGGVGIALGLREKPKRKCKPLIKNFGWWNKVWNMYSDDRFKKCFRVSKGTFQYILEHIKDDLLKQTVTEEPISPEKRVAICLLRLNRGDYSYTIAELTGVGESTVCSITEEVLT